MQTSNSSFSLPDPLCLYFFSFLKPPHPSYLCYAKKKKIISLFITLSPTNFALRISRQSSPKREFWGWPTTMYFCRQKMRTRPNDQLWHLSVISSMILGTVRMPIFLSTLIHIQLDGTIISASLFHRWRSFLSRGKEPSKGRKSSKLEPQAAEDRARDQQRFWTRWLSGWHLGSSPAESFSCNFVCIRPVTMHSGSWGCEICMVFAFHGAHPSNDWHWIHSGSHACRITISTPGTQNISTPQISICL